MIVREFHLAVGQAAPEHPPLRPDPDLVRLRMRLIREEFREVMAELALLAREDDPDKVNELYRTLLKEMADLRYVVDGTAVSLGLPLDEAFEDVHASNMSKLVDGRAIFDSGGKVMKGPGYQEPDMLRFVARIIDIEEA